MKYYKLTNAQDETYGCCKWGKNVEHTAPGKGPLCTEGWIHCYNHPILAVIFNPIHGGYGPKTAHLWECEIAGRMKEDGGIKFGVEKLRTIRRMPLPIVTNEQKVKFGILCVLEVYYDKKFRKWASRWLSGKDRTREAAEVAKDIIKTVGPAGSPEREDQLAEASWAAKTITTAAESSPERVMGLPARAAERAAVTAEATKKKIDFIKIAEKAMEKDEG